ETILSNNKVVLDFTGVDVVSNAFADECIAKLLMEMSLADLKEKTTFAGLNELAKMNIALALKRRQISMTEN
ncbi:MAG: STAS-like domain-containing protein, partial [Bacteroidales bacterium]|nr:STAS-like domain-containing protein [Bacteroidales bacterium]